MIFSSRAIPGNEKAVARVINGLVTQGVEVITDQNHLVHVSGHPRRAELIDMIGWVRPKILIPAHGEALHLAEHAALARKAGVPEVLVCRNGDLVRLAPGPAAIIDEVPSGRLYKDGSILVAADARTVASRRRLSFAGIATVALALSEQGALAADPEIELIGIPELDAAGEPMGQIVRTAVEEAFASMPRPRRRDPDAVAEAVRRAVRSAIAERWNKKPICHVHVLCVYAPGRLAPAPSYSRSYEIGDWTRRMFKWFAPLLLLAGKPDLLIRLVAAVIAAAVLFFGVWLLSNIALTFDALKNPYIAAVYGLFLLCFFIGVGTVGWLQLRRLSPAPKLPPPRPEPEVRVAEGDREPARGRHRQRWERGNRQLESKSKAAARLVPATAPPPEPTPSRPPARATLTVTGPAYAGKTDLIAALVQATSARQPRRATSCAWSMPGRSTATTGILRRL